MDMARLVAERRDGYLDDVACADALRRGGFADGDGARQALDQMLARPPADLDVAQILAGCVLSADPQRALLNSARLLSTEGRPPAPVDAAALTAFVGASQHMADLLCSRPELLARLGTPFDPSVAQARYEQAGAHEDAERLLRRCQQEDMLAIAWSDLVEDMDVEQVTVLLSRLADAIISGAAHGLGAHRWFAIIALGKLGGLELNYSSDIDLIFVRPDTVTDQVQADRVARQLVQRLGRNTADGHLYRTDMRLRPEGAAGVLTRTVSSCLGYYRDLGRPWERQMLTKARLVVDAEDAGETFLREVRQWILACGLDAGAVRQFKRLKHATEERSLRESGGTDVKQAPGGIRDIETIVQFLSLVNAAKNPWLLCNATLHGLERLRMSGALSSLEVAHLRGTYLYHRRLENRLQVMHRVQTHRLPIDRGPLARLMGARDSATFDVELDEHRRRVRAIFERHFAQAFPSTEGPNGLLSQLLLDGTADPSALDEPLRELGLRDTSQAGRILRRAAAPVSRFLPASPRLLSSFANIAPALLERLSLAAEPEASLDRFERMTRGVGAREVLYAQFQDEPRLLDMLCDLASGSPFLADMLASEPPIVDAFVDALLTGIGGRRSRRELLAQIAEGPSVDPWLVLSDHKKLELLRIGLLDLQGAIPTQKVLSELSHLCIDILRATYDLVSTEMEREHGEPMMIKGVSAQVPADMVVLALGKVGGLEANYASDADLVFVHSGDGETTRGMPNSVFFAKVAEEFIARASGARGSPRLYPIDARLRPEGAKGPLVSSLRTFQKYYEGPRVALFEHLAGLKARVVAGDAALGQRVITLLRGALRKVVLPDDLPDRLRELRGKIEAKAHGHDLKRGTGGMVDIEQLTQSLQLRHAASHPSILVQETPRALEMLGDLELLRPDEARWLADTYLFFRRVETRLQIALGLDTKEVPADPAAARVLALRLGYADSVEGDAGHLLLLDLEEASTSTRARYERLIHGG